MNEGLWYDISRYVAIGVNPEYANNRRSISADERDEYIDDPTAALSVVQASDYLQGILWGTGDGVISLEPSDWVLQREDESTLNEYYQFRTAQLLKNMNHSESGFNSAQKAYFPDQVAFGTSGIGAFMNPEFVKENEEAPYIFRNYGVDNMCIDEGKNGMVDVMFFIYNWRVNRIISEFWDVKDKLPQQILEAYAKNDFNKEFTLVHGILPREDYAKKYKGKRGAKYKGCWFMESSDKNGSIFHEEDFRKLPVGICRAIKVRGEVYGRSSGSILINSIKSVNYMFSKTVEILEKMASPSLGIWNNAIMGDSVLDTSAEGLVVFNASQMPANVNQPVFPIHEIGNPEGIIKFLIPYLNDKIATGFKTDVLLDFSNSKDMTATESMQRYNIRGRSLAGLMQQQKIECFEPLIHRCLQLEDDMNLAGVNPLTQEGLKEIVEQANHAQVIIPAAVLEAMKQGKQWYTIKWNNEIDRLSRTQAMERVIQAVNAVIMIGQVFPHIVEAVEWYDIWKDVNKYLGVDYIKNEKEFKAAVQQQIEMQRGAMEIEAMKAGGQIAKDRASAKKDEATTSKVNS